MPRYSYDHIWNVFDEIYTVSLKVEDLENDGKYFTEKAGVKLNVSAHLNSNKASGERTLKQHSWSFITSRAI